MELFKFHRDMGKMQSVSGTNPAHLAHRHTGILPQELYNKIQHKPHEPEETDYAILYKFLKQIEALEKNTKRKNCLWNIDTLSISKDGYENH